MSAQEASQSYIVDYDRWEKQLPALSSNYQSAQPYPHIAIENFLNPEVLDACIREFDKLNETDGWINYVHFNENKRGLNKADMLPPTIKRTIDELNSPRFLQLLSNLTGIKNILKDDSMEGGGLHQSRRGGFLNIHADFTVHPHQRNWQRRINILVYLNKDWQESWGGGLELWDRGMKACEKRIMPVFNRCVIFNTDADSFHGHPEPMTCPEDRFRRSIALYYYTEEENPYKHATLYKPRPEDTAGKSIVIKMDSMMVSVYTAIKGMLGSNDKVISSFLKLFSGKKK